MSYASVDATEFLPQPRPMMMRMAASQASAPPSPVEDFTPSKITLTVHVNVLFHLK